VVTRLDVEDDAHDEEREADDKKTDGEQPELELVAYGHVYLLDTREGSDHERDLLVRVDRRREEPGLDGVPFASHLRFASRAGKNSSSKCTASPASKRGRRIGVPLAPRSTIAGATAQGKIDPSVPVSTIPSIGEEGCRGRGASPPQSESASQTFKVRMGLPRNAPSWCQEALSVSSGTRRSVHLFNESAGRSPRKPE
jgi:hypothetical protein